MGCNVGSGLRARPQLKIILRAGTETCPYNGPSGWNYKFATQFLQSAFCTLRFAFCTLPDKPQYVEQKWKNNKINSKYDKIYLKSNIWYKNILTTTIYCVNISLQRKNIHNLPQIMSVKTDWKYKIFRTFVLTLRKIHL